MESHFSCQIHKQSCTGLLHFPPFAVGNLMQACKSIAVHSKARLLPVSRRNHFVWSWPQCKACLANNCTYIACSLFEIPVGTAWGLTRSQVPAGGVPCGNLPITRSEALSEISRNDPGVGTTSVALSSAVRILPPLWNWSGRGCDMRSPNVKHTAIKVVPVLHSNFLFVSTNSHIPHPNTLSVFRTID